MDAGLLQLRFLNTTKNSTASFFLHREKGAFAFYELPFFYVSLWAKQLWAALR